MVSVNYLLMISGSKHDYPRRNLHSNYLPLIGAVCVLAVYGVAGLSWMGV